MSETLIFVWEMCESGEWDKEGNKFALNVYLPDSKLSEVLYLGTYLEDF